MSERVPVFVVVDGNPLAGFRIWGPFTHAEAEDRVEIFTGTDDGPDCLWITVIRRGPQWTTRSDRNPVHDRRQRGARLA